MSGAPRPCGGSRECLGNAGLKETGFLAVLRSRGSFFKRKMYHLCLLLLKKKKGEKKKQMGGAESSATGSFPLLFLSLGRRVHEKALPFWGRDTNGKHMLMREMYLGLRVPWRPEQDVGGLKLASRQKAKEVGEKEVPLEIGSKQ